MKFAVGDFNGDSKPDLVAASKRLFVPLFRRIEISFEPVLATTRSDLPSRLKSPTATPFGLVPTVKRVGPPKLPAPVFKMTPIVLKSRFVATKSGLLSPLKSPSFPGPCL